MFHLAHWVWTHWMGLAAIGWAVEKLLETVGTFTNSKLVDNLGVMLGKFLQGIGMHPPAPPAAPA